MNEYLNDLEICPSCGKKHDPNLKEDIVSIKIKNQKISYKEKYFYCEKTKEEFIPGKLMDENLLRAKDTYRMKNNLLTSKQIKNIRNKYELSQKSMANILGWGIKTITRYENKLIQNEAHDDVMKMLCDDPAFGLKKLKINKKKINKKNYEKYKKIFIKKIENEGILNKKKDIVEEAYLKIYEKFDKKNEYNGYKKLNLKKLGEVIYYIVTKLKEVSSIKLLKILWQSDFLNYKVNGKGLSGLVYNIRQFGTVPFRYEEILDLYPNYFDTKITKINDNIEKKYLPKDKKEITMIDNKEKEILDEVINKYKNGKQNYFNELKSNKIKKLTHNNEILSYRFAKKINEN